MPTKYGKVQCFWCEPTELSKVYLRVYSRNPYHGAKIHIDTQHDQVSGVDPKYEGKGTSHYPAVYDDRDDWPTVCDCHGEPFTDPVVRQLFYRRIYTDPEGRRFTTEEMPPGAMRNAKWWPKGQGPDGISLMIRLPCGHDWHVDSKASNCKESEIEHFCWPRTGDPRIPGEVHVAGGDNICKVGAGSIGCMNGRCYHGFLRKGALVDA